MGNLCSFKARGRFALGDDVNGELALQISARDSPQSQYCAETVDKGDAKFQTMKESDFQVNMQKIECKSENDLSPVE